MLPVKIAGLGHYLPRVCVTSAQLEEKLGLPSGWIERRTGIRERRYASGDETALTMAAAAARMATAAAGLEIGELDLIVGASSSPHQMIPCTAALVQRELGMPDGHSACFDVNATCLSFLFALQTTVHLVAAGVYRNALIISSEVTANSLNPLEPESAVLMGDAAAAAVICRTPEDGDSAIWHQKFATFSSGVDFAQVVGCGTSHHPNDPRTVPHMNTFHMDGPAIFKLAGRKLKPFLHSFLETIDWRPETIDAVIPHQASRHGIEFLTSRLGFNSGQVIINLPNRGNCIAASVPLALAEAVCQGQVERGDRLLLLATGAGLTLGAIALTF